MSDPASARREAAQFEKFVIPEPNSGCFLWLGTVTGRGYGRLRSGGRVYAAHRFAWMLEHGPIPPGLFVLHRCDNPPCVNTRHLFLGTAADNAHDCVSKGRHAEQRRRSCTKGHALDGVRTLKGRRSRYCKECKHADNLITSARRWGKSA